MTRKILVYSLISLLFIVIDSTLVKFLAIGGIVPDIIVVWIVYVAVLEGQVAATTAGFAIGLVLNLAGTSNAPLGLMPLAKTLAGFIAGYFYNENKIFNTLAGYQFIVIVLVASVVHNIVYFIIFLQGSEIGLAESILFYGIPTTAYTAAVALLPMFVFARKHLT